MTDKNKNRMKTMLISLFIVIAGHPVIAQEFNGKRLQIVIGQYAVHTTIKTDSLSVDEVRLLFDFTDELFAGKSKIYDRYIYTNNEVYYRAGIGLFNRKATIYKKVNGDYVRIKS
jgi:hypothetical protein